ncbi:MAG: LysR family transcriptional regulator [Oscillospiraceae bacterium]|jgi:molybdate transport repressor ModE-like protein|nr:LysR family transcriptional regulator [Oscillospiraceae bacterium]
MDIPNEAAVMRLKAVYFNTEYDSELDTGLETETVSDFDEDNDYLPELSSGQKLWLVRKSGFFGPGIYRMLTLTAELGSIKTACAKMKMSYSKGWKLVRNAESQLGFQLIVRSQGGRFGGGCELTPHGTDLLQRYDEYRRDMQAYSDRIFGRYFGDLDA